MSTMEECSLLQITRPANQPSSLYFTSLLDTIVSNRRTSPRHIKEDAEMSTMEECSQGTVGDHSTSQPTILLV